MIYEHEDGTYTISSHQTCVPGCYADKKTARAAFQLPDEVLQALQDKVNAENPNFADRVITSAMLAEARRALRKESAG